MLRHKGGDWFYIYTMKCASTSLMKHLKTVGGKRFDSEPEGRVANIHFAVIRNPYARAVSLWRYETGGPFSKKNCEKYSRDYYDFDTFCEYGLHGEYDTKDPRMIWNQADWLSQFTVDKYVHLEDLNKELSRIVGPISRVPRENQTSGKPWKELLTLRSIDAINLWAEKDFVLGGYEKL